MASKDLHSITKKISANEFKRIETNSTFEGDIIDASFFTSFEFIMISGLVTVAFSTYTMILQHSDTNQGGDFVNVPDEQILGDPALAFITSPGQIAVSLGYIGDKRFLRANIVSVGTGSGEGSDAIGIVLVADHALHVPFAPTPTP